MIDIDELDNLISDMADAMEMVDDGAGHLTCREAGTIEAVLRYAGYTTEADRFIEAHARGDDDPEDQHRARYLELHNLPADHDAALDLEPHTGDHFD